MVQPVFCIVDAWSCFVFSHLVGEELLFAVYDIVNAVLPVVVQVAHFKVNLSDDIRANSSRCCGIVTSYEVQSSLPSSEAKG